MYSSEPGLVLMLYPLPPLRFVLTGGGSIISIFGLAYDVVQFSDNIFFWRPIVTCQNTFLPIAGTVVQLIAVWLMCMQP